MANPTPNAPDSMFRYKEGLGVWEHRGKVALAGIGHAPTARRWDETVENSIAALTITAAQKALDDAGVTVDDVDGLVVLPTGTGDLWAPRPIPEDFAKAYIPTPGRPEDGLTETSAEWMVNNMGFKNIKAAFHTQRCMSNSICITGQMIGDGLAHTVLAVRILNNLAGRYHHVSGYQGGQNAETTASGSAQWTNPFGWGAAGVQDAYTFGQYCRKYGSNHDRMAPYIVNQRKNGLMFPEGYYYQNRPELLTVEDYLAGRWISKPLSIYDCDLPIQTAICYLFTTAERAKDMKQPPVYMLNHASDSLRPRSSAHTLDEVEATTDSLARKLYTGSGLTPSEVDVYNPYDGFTLFTQYYLEAMNWHGVKRGEAHDFYAGDISVHGPHPFSSSGGNNGNGRTRCWMHTDSFQQLRGQAGQRQVKIKDGRPETAISGGPTPGGGDWMVWSNKPD